MTMDVSMKSGSKVTADASSACEVRAVCVATTADDDDEDEDEDDGVVLTPTHTATSTHALLTPASALE